VRVEGRSLYVSAEVNNGAQFDYEFDCATANQIHSAMASFLVSSANEDSSSSAGGTPQRTSTSIRDFGSEHSEADDDSLQHLASLSTPNATLQNDDAVADAGLRGSVTNTPLFSQREESPGTSSSQCTPVTTKKKNANSPITPDTAKYLPFSPEEYEVISQSLEVHVWL